MKPSPLKKKRDNFCLTWPCPECKSAMEIIPFTRVKDNKKGVVVSCWCKYEKHYFEEDLKEVKDE